MRKADYENMKRVILAMMEARAGNGLGECKFEEMEGVARRLHRIEATLKRLCHNILPISGLRRCGKGKAEAA